MCPQGVDCMLQLFPGSAETAVQQMMDAGFMDGPIGSFAADNEEYTNNSCKFF